MKPETKELFEYLKAAVRVATKSINSGLEHFQTSEEKAIKQVEELEEKLLKIELYSKMGGFIEDRNGKVCKHGDKVKWINDVVVHSGTLIFYPDQNRFFIEFYHGETRYLYNPVKKEIELIEQTEKIDI